MKREIEQKKDGVSIHALLVKNESIKVLLMASSQLCCWREAALALKQKLNGAIYNLLSLVREEKKECHTLERR